MISSDSTHNFRIGRYQAAALLCLTVAAFAVTIGQRSPWFGQTGLNMAGALTAGTAGMARNWYDEGGWTLHYAMYWEPRSIENPTLASRTPYISYPPGSVLPIYALSAAAGQPPTPKLIMAYDLANQLGIAVILGLLTLHLARLRGISPWLGWGWSCIPALLYLWFPSPFWEHQMGYFADQAVILPWVLFLYLEAVHETTARPGVKQWIRFIQGLVVFWGVFTEWLFVFVVFCAYLARVARGGISLPPKRFIAGTLLFLFPAMLALIVYAIQLYQVDAWGTLMDRMLYRTGADGNASRLLRTGDAPAAWHTLIAFGWDSRFWKDFFPQAFGLVGKPIFLGAVVMFFGVLLLRAVGKIHSCWKKTEPSENSADTLLLTTMFLALVPPILHYYALKEHSSFFLHTFAVLKFAVPMALLPLALFPIMLAARMKQTTISRFLCAACMLLGAAYLVMLHPQRQANFELFKAHDFAAMGDFIARNTTYDDVVVSNNATFPKNFIVYSMKQVHPIQSVEDIQRVVANIEGGYILTLFSKGPESYEQATGLAALAARSYQEFHEKDYYIRKIRRADFEQLYPVPPPLGEVKQ